MTGQSIPWAGDEPSATDRGRPGATGRAPGRRRRAGAGVALLVLLGLTLGALAHVGVQAKRIEIGRSLGEESKRHLELADQQRRLKLDISELKSPARLVGVARAEGFGPPTPTDVRAVDLLPGLRPDLLPGLRPAGEREGPAR